MIHQIEYLAQSVGFSKCNVSLEVVIVIKLKKSMYRGRCCSRIRSKYLNLFMGGVLSIVLIGQTWCSFITCNLLFFSVVNPTIVKSNYFVVETLNQFKFRSNIELMLGWMNLDMALVESDSLTTLANSATPLLVEFNSRKKQLPEHYFYETIKIDTV